MYAILCLLRRSWIHKQLQDISIIIIWLFSFGYKVWKKKKIAHRMLIASKILEMNVKFKLITQINTAYELVNIQWNNSYHLKCDKE